MSIIYFNTKRILHRMYLRATGEARVNHYKLPSSTLSFVHTSLSSSGFVANSTKSQWDPTQLTIWLYLHWNLVSCSISIIDRRIPNFMALLDSFFNPLRTLQFGIVPQSQAILCPWHQSWVI